MNFIFNNGQFEVKAVSGNEVDESNFGLILKDSIMAIEEIVHYQDYEACKQKFDLTVQNILNGYRPEELKHDPVEREFIFQARDNALSYNPTLTYENHAGLFYLCFDKAVDDFGGSYICGFVATNNNNGGVEAIFDELADAIASMKDQYGIKPMINRDYRNFKEYTNLSAARSKVMV